MRSYRSSFAALFLIGCGVFSPADDDSKSGPPADAPADDAGSDATVNGTVADGTLTVDAVDKTFVTQGTTTKVTVKIQRGASVVEDVVLTATGLRDGITATGKIPTGSSEGQLTVDVPAVAAQGDLPIMIEASVPSSPITPAPKGTAAGALFVRGKPGALDTTFGKAGIQQEIFGAALDAIGRDVAVGPGGEITVLGSCGAQKACLVRFDANGAFDKTFGGDGTGYHVDTWGFGVTMSSTSGGKFLIAGSATQPIAVARVDANGLLDPTFGSNGLRTFTTSQGTDFAAAIIAQGQNGEFVLAFDWTINGVPTIGTTKHTSSGAFVGNYGVQNASSAAIGDPSGAFVTGLAVRPDGRIVGVAVSGDGKSYGTFQLTSSGSYDTTYGTNGATKLSGGGTVTRGAAEDTAMLLLADGSVVGAFRMGTRVHVVKFTPAGAVDQTFGDYVDLGIAADPVGVLLDPSGNIVVPLNTNDGSMYVARFTPGHGDLDVQWGKNGVAVQAGGDTRRAAIAPDGRIVVVGRTVPPAAEDVRVVRFWN